MTKLAWRVWAVVGACLLVAIVSGAVATHVKNARVASAAEVVVAVSIVLVMLIGLVAMAYDFIGWQRLPSVKDTNQSEAAKAEARAQLQKDAADLGNWFIGLAILGGLAAGIYYGGQWAVAPIPHLIPHSCVTEPDAPV